MDKNTTDAFAALLKIVGDPAASAAKLAELQSAQKDAERRITAAAAAERRIDQKAAALEAREVEITKREQGFASMNSGFLLSLDLSKSGVLGEPDRERLWVSSKLRDVADKIATSVPNAIEPVLQINGPGPDARFTCGNWAFHERTAIGSAAKSKAA